MSISGQFQGHFVCVQVQRRQPGIEFWIVQPPALPLPLFPGAFLSDHFAARNVLAHVRCDLREGADGERVLMLHELQRDWMQSARRGMREQESGTDGRYPFLREWPALTLKLMLLHAARLGAGAMAWTRGAHQAHRYRGLGAKGLKELSDRTLPRAAGRMLKAFGLACETLEVYVPDNFSIRRTEGGYEVRNIEGAVLGVAASFQEARDLLPDGAHERRYAVHGVRLSQAARDAILEQGFPAWD